MIAGKYNNGTVVLRKLDSDIGVMKGLIREFQIKDAASKGREDARRERREERRRLSGGRTLAVPESVVSKLPPEEFIGPKRPRIYWKGADVMIVDAPVPDYRGSSRVVVSPQASLISYYFRRLRKCRFQSVNWFSKLEFYGRLAESLNECSYEQLLDPLFIRSVIFDTALSIFIDWRSRVIEPIGNQAT